MPCMVREGINPSPTLARIKIYSYEKATHL